MKPRKTWFICTDDPTYCSQVGFVSSSSPHADKWGIGAKVSPGDVYVARHEATNDSPFSVEMLLMKDELPNVEYSIHAKNMVVTSDGWIRERDVLHGILHKMVKQPKAVEIMQALVDHQLPYVHNDKLPNLGTWGYAVRAGTSFKPQQIRHMERLLLQPNGELRHQYHKLLSNPRIENFVICASGMATYQQMLLRAWKRAKGILYEFGYHQNITIWDSITLSRQLTLYPHVLSGVARFWAEELTTLE